jgi:hypothetical protein
MRLKRLIKVFEWTEEEREVVALGPNTRLNPRTFRAQLAENSDGRYPLTADLYVKSRLTNPRQVRRWIGFEANVVHARDNLGADITGALFRLDDGTSEFFYSSGAWIAAGASDWNTEQEIADNIATFDVLASDRKLRVVVNLSTTDARYTPQLVWVKVLYESAVDFQDDVIYRSLVPMLKAQIRPISQVVVKMPATGTTLNKSAFLIETGYALTGIDAVFDFTAFPEEARACVAPNLLSSYDGGTGVLTLTTSVAQDNELWIRFVYAPPIAVTTSQDYIEAEKLPSIVLTEIAALDMVEVPDGEDKVANRVAGTAVILPSPQQGDLEIVLLGMTEKGVDHQRLLEEVNAFFARNPLLVAAGIDERYRLHLITEYEQVGEPGSEEIHTGRARFRIKNFRRWLVDAFDGFVVTNAPQTAFQIG